MKTLSNPELFYFAAKPHNGRRGSVFLNRGISVFEMDRNSFLRLIE